MYNLLIVDDEIISQLGIMNMVNWQEHGFKLTSKAKNGQEALEILETTNVDLIITDVNMPIMTGIELMRECKKLYPDVLFILLSSHDDYDYVREGLQLGALDYFLKISLTPEAILACIEKVKKALLSSYKEKGEPTKIGSFELTTLRAALIKNFMFNRIENINYFLQKCEEYKMQMPFDKYCVVSYTFEQREIAQNSELSTMIFSITNDILRDFEYGYPCETSLGEISILLNFEDNSKLSSIDDLLERIVLFVDSYLNQKTNIYISDVVNRVEDIPLAYLQVCQTRQFQNLDNEGINRYSDIIGIEHAKQEHDIDKFVLEFEKCKSGILQDFINIFDETIKYINSVKFIDNKKILYFIKSIIRISYEYCENTCNKHIDLPYIDIDNESLSKLLTSKNNIIKILLQLKESLMSLEEENDNNYIIRSTKQFIQSNYSKKITIKEIADELNVSHPYLSSLFKKQTNTSIKEYLLQVQMQKAKDLLKTTTEFVSSIAIQVGYDNEYQFSKIFKQKTGMTPTQYRNMQ